MDKIPAIYYFLSKKNSKKENFKIILEPLQAILQLALLSISPIGTKLSIQNNLLYIQPPSWSQSLIRSYYMDNKEELYYLFNVIQRFHKFYKYLNHRKDHLSNMIPLITEMASKGIDRLITTYENSEKPSLMHTLEMYKILIIKPNVFLNNMNMTEHTPEPILKSKEKEKEKKYVSTKTSEPSNNLTYETGENGDFQDENSDFDSSSDVESGSDVESNNEEMEQQLTIEQTDNDNHQYNNLRKGVPLKKSNVNINDVFINIRDLYSEEILQVIYFTLLAINKDYSHNSDTTNIHYINGLNDLLKSTNNNIQKWIKNNILIS